MRFTQKLKLLIGNNMEDYLQRWFSGETVPGDPDMKIDSLTAMKYSAVFACIRVLSETFASMPAMEYRKDEKGDRKVTRDTAAYDLLHNVPNEEMSPFAFKESSMISLNLGGNAVAEKLVNRNGETVGLYPYPWQMVRIERDRQTKRLLYRVSNGTEERVLQRDQVFHVPGMSYDGVIGLSPIEYAAKAIQLGLSYEKFGVQFYKNGVHSSGAFSFPVELSEEAYRRLKEDLRTNYAGLKNSGTPMLLEGGGKFEQFAMKPVDAQLVESRRIQREDIAAFYRVPLHLIQDLSRSTNNNIEHQSLEFVMYTMLPWFRRWEQAINAQLLSPAERRAGYYIEFNMAALLRGDQKSRAEAYEKGRLGGWLSVNDIRRLENQSPIPNGDIYLQPLNYKEAGTEDPENQTATAMLDKISRMIAEGR